MNAKFLRASVLLLLLSGVPGAFGADAGTNAGAAAAEVSLVTGAVSASGPGGSRSLGTGDKVFAGDTISVSVNSYVNLHFADGGRVLLRPETEFAVESYKYSGAPVGDKPGAKAEAPAAGAGEAFFKLVRGGFRAVSGLIGKGERQGYRVTTPLATIGIRGTDYEVQTCEADCPTEGLPNKAANDGTRVASNGPLQLADAGAGGVQGIVVATNQGSIVLETPKGQFAVDAGQVALTLSGGQTFMLPAVPEVLLRKHTPSPEQCE